MIRHFGWGGVLLVACSGAQEPSDTDAVPETDDSDLPPWTFSCPGSVERATVATITDDRIQETSGIAASRKAPSRWWVHNDSGDAARTFALADDGSVTAEVKVQGVLALDWEDMAWRPGSSGEGELLLGDLGDNAEARAFVQITVIAEPDPDAGAIEVAATEIRLFSYGDETAHDVEALFADPDTQALYVVTKERTADTIGVFEAPAHAPEGQEGPEVMARIATLDPEDPLFVGDRLVTGGDISPDGRFIALRTLDKVLVYPRPWGTSIAEAFSGEPCVVQTEPEPQGEAVAFGPGGDLFTLSENKGQPLWRYTWPLIAP